MDKTNLKTVEHAESISSQDILDFNVDICLGALKLIESKLSLSRGDTVNLNDVNNFPAKSWFLRQALFQAERVLTALALSKLSYQFDGTLQT